MTTNTGDIVETRGRGRPRDQLAHDDILEAALSLLDEQCYSEITIEKIAARAGCGKPTIYRRWRTKADLVLEAYANRAAQAAPPVVPSGDALHDLKLLLARLFQVAKDPVNRRAVGGFIAEAQFDPEFRQKVVSVFLTKRRDVIRSILVGGQLSGQLRADLNVEATIDIVYGAFIYRLIFGHAEIDGALAGAITDTLRRGILAPAAASPQT